MDLSQEGVLSVLVDGGGKVKNSELLRKFSDHLNGSDPAEKKRKRDLFKTFVNNVAVVKELDDGKHVVLRNRFQHLIAECTKTRRPDGEGKLEVGAAVASESPEEAEASSQESQDGDQGGAEQLVHPDSDGNSFSFIEMALQTTSSYDLKPKKALNFVLDQVTAINKSSPQGGVVYPGQKEMKSGQKPCALPLRMPVDGEADHSQKSTMDAVSQVGKQQGVQSSRNKRRTLEEGTSTGSLQSRKVSRSARGHSDDPERTEHEWLVRCAAGQWSQVYGLLLQDVHLAEKKDLISGFTALHWAAKAGNSDMACKIITLPQKSGRQVDVNTKTHAGYTPLHIAVIHNHEAIMALLVHDYGADKHIRDNSGKKPYHYLNKGVAAKTRELLGEPKAHHQEGVHEKEDAELPKGHSTLTRLFQPHTVGPKRRQKQREGFFSLYEEPKEEREEMLHCNMDHFCCPKTRCTN
uniref:SOWAHA-C winged helix-turn-helix domain-containing protein n=1 Tax=Denticeps clupeoides TaxID=299321 RepID=A0AAY4BB35_9TELE